MLVPLFLPFATCTFFLARFLVDLVVSSYCSSAAAAAAAAFVVLGQTVPCRVCTVVRAAMYPVESYLFFLRPPSFLASILP